MRANGLDMAEEHALPVAFGFLAQLEPHDQFGQLAEEWRRGFLELSQAPKAHRRQ